MTTKELKLAAFLLDRAADEFGNHGCNDVDQEIIDAAGFTPEEEEAFCAEAQGELSDERTKV